MRALSPLLPGLFLVAIAVALRAAGRALAARRLGGRTGAREPTTPRRRAALAVSGPAALYATAALTTAAYLLVHGEDRETNVVDILDKGPAAGALEIDPAERTPPRPRGMISGDRIVAMNDRPTPDGESIRRLESWVEGVEQDGEVTVTVIRDGAPRQLAVNTVQGSWSRQMGVIPRVEHRRVGLAEALRRGLAFPASPGSGLRWLGQLVGPRLVLNVRAYPIGGSPPPPESPWPVRLADALGLAAGLLLLPWPGLDGGALVLAAYEAIRRKRPPAWLEQLWTSRLWGAAMAAVVLVTAVPVAYWVIDTAERRDDQRWHPPYPRG